MTSGLQRDSHQRATVVAGGSRGRGHTRPPSSAHRRRRRDRQLSTSLWLVVPALTVTTSAMSSAGIAESRRRFPTALDAISLRVGSNSAVTEGRLVRAAQCSGRACDLRGGTRSCHADRCLCGYGQPLDGDQDAERPTGDWNSPRQHRRLTESCRGSRQDAASRSATGLSCRGQRPAVWLQRSRLLGGLRRLVSDLASIWSSADTTASKVSKVEAWRAL